MSRHNDYAMCKPNGEVCYVIRAAYMNHEHGKTMENGLIAYALPPEISDSQALELLCVDGVWSEKPPKPGEHYFWTEDGWQPNQVTQWHEIRETRNGLLFGSDWTQLADAPITPEQKTAWATYRQELRSMPLDQAAALPNDITWPIRPE